MHWLGDCIVCENVDGTLAISWIDLTRIVCVLNAKSLTWSVSLFKGWLTWHGKCIECAVEWLVAESLLRMISECGTLYWMRKPRSDLIPCIIWMRKPHWLDHRIVYENIDEALVPSCIESENVVEFLYWMHSDWHWLELYWMRLEGEKPSRIVVWFASTIDCAVDASGLGITLTWSRVGLLCGYVNWIADCIMVMWLETWSVLDARWMHWLGDCFADICC